MLRGTVGRYVCRSMHPRNPALVPVAAYRYLLAWLESANNRPIPLVRPTRYTPVGRSVLRSHVPMSPSEKLGLPCGMLMERCAIIEANGNGPTPTHR